MKKEHLSFDMYVCTGGEFLRYMRVCSTVLCLARLNKVAGLPGRLIKSREIR